MTNESRRLAVTGSATKRSVVLTFSTCHPWRLRAVFDDGAAWDVEDSDLFECLIQVRKRLEGEGALICCEGARRDVFPSGMARQMGGARRAYRLVSDRAAESPTLVDIFAPTPCDAVVGVSEQTESVRKLHRG
jgi:hypothetical protein